MSCFPDSEDSDVNLMWDKIWRDEHPWLWDFYYLQEIEEYEEYESFNEWWWLDDNEIDEVWGETPPLYHSSLDFSVCDEDFYEQEESSELDVFLGYVR